MRQRNKIKPQFFTKFILKQNDNHKICRLYKIYTYFDVGVKNKSDVTNILKNCLEQKISVEMIGKIIEAIYGLEMKFKVKPSLNSIWFYFRKK